MSFVGNYITAPGTASAPGTISIYNGSNMGVVSSTAYDALNIGALVIIHDDASSPQFASTVTSKVYVSGQYRIYLDDVFPLATGTFPYSFANGGLGLGYYSLETVYRSNCLKASSLDKTAMCLADSDQAMINDYDGVLREFALDGVVKFPNTPALSNFMAAMDNFVNGNQYAYTDCYLFLSYYLRGTSSRPFRVMVDSFGTLADHSDPPVGACWLAYTFKATERGLF